MGKRVCMTQGCGGLAAEYSTICIACQLAGKPEYRGPGRPRTYAPTTTSTSEPPKPKKKIGRPCKYDVPQPNSIYSKRHYHKLRAAGLSAQCASYKHRCSSCPCWCHAIEKVA